MVRYQSLEGKWSADTTNYTVTSESGDKIRLGDPLKVVVKSVDLERKQIDFTIL
jgi:exoribonuclease R